MYQLVASPGPTPWPAGCSPSRCGFWPRI